MKRLLLSFVLALAGCGPPGPRPAEIDVRPRSGAALLASIRERTHPFETARLGFQLVWRDSSVGDDESIGVGLSYESPGRIRARGTAAAFFTAFELVVGRERIWLDLPRDELTVVGERDDPAWAQLPLGPDQLLEALFGDPCADGPCPPKLRLSAEDGAFVVHSSAWTLWVDDQTQLPMRASHEGADPYEVTWGEWAIRAGAAWPHRTEIRFRDRDVSVEVRLARIRVGLELPESLFEFAPEPDRHILTPEEAPWTWPATESKRP